MRLQSELIPLQHLLDDNEKQRAARFKFDKHRHRFIAAHAACRLILGRYIDNKPDRLEFQFNEHGKPYLTTNPTHIEFNLSHSQDRALLGINQYAAIGVDIEYTGRHPEWVKLARRFYSPDEIDYLFQQPENQQRDIFFQIWTRKEAYIKALGTGLSTPLPSFSVTAKNDGIKHDRVNEPTRWYRKDIPVVADYKAALVLSDTINCVNYFSFNNDTIT